jgi:hypothetical protein
MLGDFAALAVGIECKSSDQWTIVFPAGSSKTVEYCEVPVRKAELQTALDAAAQRSVQFAFRVLSGPAVRTVSEVPVSSTVARSQRLRQLAEHPYVRRLCELVQGEIVRVDPAQIPPAAPPQATQGAEPSAHVPPPPREAVSAADAH